MSERSRFEIYKKKLQGICDENNLVFRFRNDIYPITLTIKPANDFDAQLSMIENAEENGFTSPDAYIAFAYKDGDIDFHMSDSFTISDVLFSKIKNLYKKMHSLWLQFFFREIIQNEVLKSRNLPKIEDDDEDEQDIDDDGEPMDGDDDLDADELDTGDLGNDLNDEDGDDGAQDNHERDTVDALFDEACRIVREDGKASTARLQRHFRISYSRAASLMAELEAAGVVGTYNGSSPREVIGFTPTVEASTEADDGYGYDSEVAGDEVGNEND